MKKVLLALLTFATVFTACEKDEETTTPTTTPNEETPEYEFLDQNLQGKIGGQSWDMAFGFAKTEAVYDFELNEFVDTYFFRFFNAQDTNACDLIHPKTDEAIFTIDELKPQLLDFQDENSSQSATLIDESDTLSIGAIFGAIEILTVDTNAGVITGRMDVREFPSTTPTDNYLNGNFSITYCK